MNLKNLLYIIIVITVIGGGYFAWLQAKYNDTEKLSGISCPQIFDRYGVSVQYLVNKINNEPESAVVMRDFRQISGEVISTNNNLFLYIHFNESGKINSFICKDKKIYARLDSSRDFSLTIPEADFKNIVQNIDNLNEGQVASYLGNIKTDLAGIKKTILERILN